MAGALTQKLHEKAPGVVETYMAYGATGDLIKECARPGDYQIPQALVKGAEIPVDENGTHIGEAEGWWFESRSTCLLSVHGHGLTMAKHSV